MISHKEIHLNIWKEYDYVLLCEEEKHRAKEIMIAVLEELVNRFDGPAKVKIKFEVKGNC